MPYYDEHSNHTNNPYTSTYEGYMMFRMSEAEHMEKNYPAKDDTAWVYQSKNVEYEAFLMDAYDRGMTSNSMNY